MPATGKARHLGLGCLVLFALPFAAVGIGGTYWAWRTVSQHAAMQLWVEVPAVIKGAEFKEQRRRKNRSHHAIAVYEYEYKGRKYTGDRIGLHGGSDNIGSFQRDAFNELNRHRAQNKPFRCFVNPQNPAEAVLYRDLRWELLAFYTTFAAVFGGIGFGLISGALAHARRQPSTPPAKATDDEPWLARADWASGQILPTGGAAAAVPVLAAVTFIWWIACAPLLSKLTEILPPAKDQLAWLTLAFPAVGLALLAALVHQVSRKRKFGDSILQLATTPGVVGGQLAGVVRIQQIVHAAKGFHLKLSCVERVAKKNDDAMEQVIWQDERLVLEPMRDIAAGTMAVPVLFAIPYEARETSHGKSKHDIDWRLEVSAKLPGVDYKTRFEVPVFKTPESRPDFQLDEKLSADFTAAPPRDLLLREAGIVRERLPGEGVRLVFPAARNLGSALVATVFLAFWSAAIWFMLHFKVFILFPIVFGLFELLIVWIVIELWFYRSVVEARVDGLTFRGGLFGIGRKHAWSAEEVNGFDTTDSMSSGTHVWKNIVVRPRNGKKRMIARTISGKLAQQAVIDELNAGLRRGAMEK